MSLHGDPALGNGAFSEACCVELPQNEGVGEGVSVSWMGQKIIQWQQVLATPWESWEEAGTPHAGALTALNEWLHPGIAPVLKIANKCLQKVGGGDLG